MRCARWLAASVVCCEGAFVFPGLTRRRGQMLPVYYAFAGVLCASERRENRGGWWSTRRWQRASRCWSPQRCGCAEDMVDSGAKRFLPSIRRIARNWCSVWSRWRVLATTEREAMGMASTRIVGEFTPERFGRKMVARIGRLPLSQANSYESILQLV